MRQSPAHRVVIIGGGFGGIDAAKALKHAPVEIALVDRRNFHLFQPLLYQVATAGLSPGEIAAPLRGIFRRQKNVEVYLAEVIDVDAAARRVLFSDGAELGYDTLIVAAGSRDFTSAMMNGRPLRLDSRRWKTRWRFGGACCSPSRRPSGRPTAAHGRPG